MSRKKDFNEDEALETAMLLFWKMGYEATSMQALEDNMQLSRTSIYNAFGNKRSLFELALSKYLNTVLKKFITVLHETVSTKEAIKNVLYEVINLHFNKYNPGGCMVVLSILENHQHDNDMKNMLDSALKKLNKEIVKRLQQGVKDGDFKNSENCKSTGNQVTALITGMIVMAKASFQKKELESIIDNFMETLIL